MRHGIGKLCVVSMAVGLIQLAVGFDLCPNLWNDLYVESPYQKTTTSSPIILPPQNHPPKNLEIAVLRVQLGVGFNHGFNCSKGMTKSRQKSLSE